jgi:salicylate hydroxylase
MAVEDGAVLGELLGMLSKQSTSSDTSQHIPSLLHLYESLRKSRTTLNVQGAVANRTMFHMEDGKEQEARDRALRNTDWRTGCECYWADIDYQKKLLAWDAVRNSKYAFEKWWEQRHAHLVNAHI